MIDAQIEGLLKLEQPDELMVYLHLPFCSTRCGYCDFYSETGVSEARMAATLQGILREAEWYRSIYPNARVSSLYLGGGTPSLVPAKLLAPFLNSLSQLFAPLTRAPLTRAPLTRAPRTNSAEEFEWSFEANPESLNAEKLDLLAESGVNRLSLGVQSFNDRFLRALDRQADSRMVQRAVDAVKQNGSFQLSLDLMTGLPGQNQVDVAADAEQLLAYTPEHISLYSLTVEQGTPLARRVEEGLVSLGATPHRDRLWETAAKILRGSGYRHYEISNFCLPGKHARHNSGYWQGRPYIGLGPGAVGTLPSGGPPDATSKDATSKDATSKDATSKAATSKDAAAGGAAPPGVRAVRITNPELHDYLRVAGGRGDAVHTLEYLSGRDLVLERFLMGLRTSEGVRLRACVHEFGVELSQLHKVLEDWEGAEYLDRRCLGAGRAVLRRSGRMLLDRLLPDLAVRLETL